MTNFFGGVSKRTIIRTVLFFGLMILMNIFSIIIMLIGIKHGYIESVTAGGYITTMVTADATAIRSWWKNNSFSAAAQFGDKMMAVFLDSEDEDDEDEDNE